MILRTLTVGVGGFLGASARLFLMVGVLGGYTTFSTFGYETIALLLPALDEMVKEGLATVEKATVLFYRAGERPHD